LKTIIYLVRHGETDWNAARRVQGHSDIDLNERGFLQARRLGEHLRGKPIHAVYSSDLSRARSTAAQIARHFFCEVVTDRSLRERCYGEWEGLTYEEVQARFAGRDESSCGIESFAKMQERAVRTMTELALRHPGESIVVVSHGGFINCFLHYVTGGRQGTGITKIDNTGYCVFQYCDQNWEVHRVNSTDHLPA